jgi:hypothetical protein
MDSANTEISNLFSIEKGIEKVQGAVDRVHCAGPWEHGLYIK